MRAERTKGAVRESVSKDPRTEIIREKVRVSPGLSPRSFFLACGIENPSELRERRVLDLGGGFGGLAEILSGLGARVTVADPVFFESDVEALYRQDLERAERRYADILKKIRETADP